MAGAADLTGCTRIEAMFAEEVGGAVVQGSPGVAMACRAVGHTLLADIFRVCTRQTGGIGTGIEQAHQQQKH